MLKSLIPILLFTTMTLAQSLKVDHAAICAYDLQSLQDAFATAGLRAEYGGAHATGGTHNALLGFDDGSYLELIALQKPGSATGGDLAMWKGLKPESSRVCFWAIHTDHLKEMIESFQKAKVEISDPQPGSRKKPDGTVLQWQTAAVSEDKGGDILPFAIQDITPRTSRIQPSASVKGSELTGLKRVVIAVKDLDAAIHLYRRAYSLPAPQLETSKDFAAKLAYFPGTAVILAAPLSDNSWLTRHLSQFGQGPVAVLIGTSDVAKTKARLTLGPETSWFNSKINWLPANKLQGVRLGVIAE